MSGAPRSFKQSERGQVLLIFILVFVTMILIGMIAVTAGQVLVRRQQAQMVVDAAAFAGASRQAEGMNTIAHLNAQSLLFLQMIEASMLLPHFDSSSTTNERLIAFLATPIAGFFINDWYGNVLEEYDDGFEFYNNAINVTNCAYAPAILPRMAAAEVVEENFGGEEKLFASEDMGSHGPADLTAMASFSLVELTDPEEYDVGGYWYLPDPTHWFATPTNCPKWPVGTAMCAYTYGNYIAMDAFIFLWRSYVDPISYELGRFYDNDEGDDVRFAYYLKISQAPVLFGKNFFDDIPEVIVAAAAKPYGGYLGDTFSEGGISGDGWDQSYPDPEWDDPGNSETISFDPFGIFHNNQPGKAITKGYRAKLVPLTTQEKLMLAIHDTEDIGRWNPLTILH